MVVAFLNFGNICKSETKFELEEKEFSNNEDCESTTETERLSLKTRIQNLFSKNFTLFKGDFKKKRCDVLYFYRVFYAKSTPCYLIAKFKQNQKENKESEGNIKHASPEDFFLF